MAQRKLKIRDLTLRDGQQSLFATRLSQAEIDKLLPFYENAGFYIMEVWGGAVPDSVMRYLDESPWDRLRIISKAMKGKSLLSALSRGRNLFGYVPYPDYVLEGFYKEAIANGLNVMRIFDALNDIDNVRESIRLINELGGIADPYGRDAKLNGFPLKITELIAQLDGTCYVTRQSAETPAAVRKTKNAIKKAFQNTRLNKGTSFVEVVGTCNSGWKQTPVDANNWMRENMFKKYPLGDMKDI